MGEEGHSYREILSFYYPGTKLGVGAQGTQWQQLDSEDVELFTTRPERDRALLPLATRLMHEAEESTGLVYNGAAKLKVYPTVAAFRDATGEPGWVAASTQGRTIRLQPTDVLARCRHIGEHVAPRVAARTGGVACEGGDAAVVSRRAGVVPGAAQYEGTCQCAVRQRGGVGEGVAVSGERTGIAAGVCGRGVAGGEVWRESMEKRRCWIGCRMGCRRSRQFQVSSKCRALRKKRGPSTRSTASPPLRMTAEKMTAVPQIGSSRSVCEARHPDHSEERGDADQVGKEEAQSHAPCLLADGLQIGNPPDQLVWKIDPEHPAAGRTTASREAASIRDVSAQCVRA